MLNITNLLLNPDGSIYHLALHPDEIADIIITVGDPGRVAQVSKYFDNIECKKQKREFITHTGYFNNRRISVISTGIGIGNIDICINELDALFNIDLKTRECKDNCTRLKIIRIGTSGAIQPDIAVDSFIVSDYAIGLDSLSTFYQVDSPSEGDQLAESLRQYLTKIRPNFYPYLIKASRSLSQLFQDRCHLGLTMTCEGFYAPQGRSLRAQVAMPNFLAQLQSFDHNHLKITNLEMETAALYLLAHVLGHEYCSLNAMIVNRVNHQKSADIPKLVERLIQYTLEKIVTMESL